MNFLFLKIVDKKILDTLKEIRQEQLIRSEAISDLKKEFGANLHREYRHGGIAFFSFPNSVEIDRKIWKKAHDGFYPKTKTVELQKVRNLPEARDFIDAVKPFGFGGEMVIGSSVGGKGFPMYNTQIAGHFETMFFYLKVPYQTEKYEKEIPDSFVQLEEWEVLKEMEEKE